MKSKNKLSVMLPLLLSGCGKARRDEILFSLGITVFLVCVFAYLIHLLVDKIGSARLVREFMIGHPSVIKWLAWFFGLVGVALFIYGLQLDGSKELLAFVGLACVIIGAILPRSVDREKGSVNMKGVSIFIVCIYVLLFLIFQGHLLFDALK